MNKVIIIFFISIIFFSCTREKGFIPSPKKYDAHYYDLQPELVWCEAMADQNELVSLGAINNYIIANLSNDRTLIFASDNGEMTSEFDSDIPYPGSGINGPVEVVEIGNFYYLIEKNHPRVFKLYKDQGNLMKVLSPAGSFQEFKSTSEIIRKENEIIFISQNNLQRTQLISFNFTTEVKNEITRLESLELTFGFVHQMVYSPSNKSIYVLSVDDNDTFKVFSIHIETGEIEILLSQAKEIESNRPVELSISGNYLYPLFDEKLYSIDISSGSIKWTLQSDIVRKARESFVHLNSLYLKQADNLFKIDLETGNPLWESQFFCRDSYARVPGQELALSIVYQAVEEPGSDGYLVYRNYATIYELQKGQRLVEWEIPRSDTSKSRFFEQILYYENDIGDKIMYVTTDKNIICKYQWPF